MKLHWGRVALAGRQQTPSPVFTQKIGRIRNLGFTLIELSIVLAIVSMVLYGIILYLTNLVANQRQSTTETKEQTIKTALQSFIARNYRLPCPANPTIADGATNDGVEVSTPGTCSGLTALGGVVTGSVPWSTLGLQKDASIDAYAYNRFTYVVTQSATNLTSATISGMKGAITIHSAGPGSAANQTNDCTTGTMTYNPCSAVLAIISHGPNGYGAYTSSGTQISFPASITGFDEKENANADQKIVIKSYSESDTNPYNDTVLSLTSGDILSSLISAGSIKDFRATLNATFDLIKGAVIASAISSFTSGRYYLPNTIPSLTSSQIADPWNNSIIYNTPNSTYVTSGVRSNSSANATAFTLTSRGPDGVSGTTDDTTITVLVGDLQAIFVKTGY